jgi:hypothetical protein
MKIHHEMGRLLMLLSVFQFRQRKINTYNQVRLKLNHPTWRFKPGNMEGGLATWIPSALSAQSLGGSQTILSNTVLSFNQWKNLYSEKKQDFPKVPHTIMCSLSPFSHSNPELWHGLGNQEQVQLWISGCQLGCTEEQVFIQFNLVAVQML